MGSLARTAVLTVFQWPAVRRWMEKHGMALGAGRFVAGERAEDALRVAADLLAAAAEAGALVEIDMEDSGRVDATLAAYERLAPEYPGLGLCLQAYLHRTAADLDRLLPLRPRIRLVKGAYAEPPSAALRDRAAVGRRYLDLAGRLLAAGCFLAAATHDGPLLEAVLAEARRRGRGPEHYEVQVPFPDGIGSKQVLP